MFDAWVREIPCRRKLATRSGILAWKIPWAEEPGGSSPGVHTVTKRQTPLSTHTHTLRFYPCKNLVLGVKILKTIKKKFFFL